MRRENTDLSKKNKKKEKTPRHLASHAANGEGQGEVEAKRARNYSKKEEAEWHQDALEIMEQAANLGNLKAK